LSGLSCADDIYNVSHFNWFNFLIVLNLSILSDINIFISEQKPIALWMLDGVVVNTHLCQSGRPRVDFIKQFTPNVELKMAFFKALL
jgi:hypothetical protein